jgi:5-methylcytosine-specific restriction endonuclease McrA
MKEQILQLRSSGKSYRQIVNELGCSKGTVAYHCGNGQKEKSRQRVRKNKKTIRGKIRRKVEKFLLEKVQDFKRGGNGYNKTTGRASYDAFYQKISDHPVCYLTGRGIDLSLPSTYSLDHIIPRSKGGENSLINCGLSCRDANKSKSDLELHDFIQLCKDVCENFGYNVIK